LNYRRMFRCLKWVKGFFIGLLVLPVVVLP